MEYKSHYICKCNNLLYLDLKSNEEFCLNRDCNNCIDEMPIFNTVPAEEKVKEINQSFVNKLHKLSKDEFLFHLEKFREILLQKYFSMEGLNIKLFFGVNELIRLTANLNSEGGVKSEEEFNIIINSYSDHHNNINFLDDLHNFRYVLTENKMLVLKYAKVFGNLFSNYGILSDSTTSDPNIFKYENIDFENIRDKNYKSGDNLLIYYKMNYRQMIVIDYLLNYYFEQSKIYKYDYIRRDVEFLLSIYYSMTSDISEVSVENFQAHLLQNCQDITTHKKFVVSLIECNGQVPIIIRTSKAYIVGKFTTFFFTLYLMGLCYEEITREGKELASSTFENHVRKELRDNNYIVPFDKEFKLFKKSYGYDIIAYSEKNKKILLIETKYKDIPSSSINGKKLIDQELYAKNGLIKMAERHNERIDFFMKELKQFNEHLKINNISEFEIQACIVSKYEPLIYQYGNIKILEVASLIKLNTQSNIDP